MLMVGPTYTALRKFCNNVRSVTTDFGVERLVACSVDIVPAFCHHFGIPLPANWKSQPFLFPLALATAGWRHLVQHVQFLKSLLLNIATYVNIQIYNL
jgi:hypothetical protein